MFRQLRHGSLGLALAFAFVTVVPAVLWAEPAEAGRWKLCRTKRRNYFVPDDQVSKQVDRRIDRSTSIGRGTDERGRNSGTKREYGQGTPTESSEDVAGAKSRETKLEGTVFKTYERWPVDTIRIVTTTTPYTDFRVTTWQEAPYERFRRTYRVRETITWRDPYTGGRYSETLTRREGPDEVIEHGAWANRSDSHATGNGTDTKVDRQKVSTRTESRVIGQVAAGAGGSRTVGADPNRPREAVALTGEAGQGSTAGRQSTFGQGMAITGAPRARSAGGRAPLDLGALFEAAASKPDLAADSGEVAWRLGVEGNFLVFTPYVNGRLDGGASVRLVRGQRSGTGPNGVHVTISDYSARPLALSGSFKRSGGKADTRLRAH